MRRFALLSGPLAYRLALAWVGLLVLLGTAGPWLPLPYPAAVPDLLHPAAAPAWHGAGPLHYLGTDPAGRDVLAELLAGTRQLILLSLPAATMATLLGALAGGAAGYWGNRGWALPLAIAPLALAVGWWGLALPYTWVILCLIVISVALFFLKIHFRHRPKWLATGFYFPLDSLVLGATTLLSAVPRLVVVLALAAGPPLSQGTLLAVLTLMAWPEAARLVRAQMLRARVLPFVEAARAAGLPEGRIWWRHTLPPACQPLWAYAPLSVAGLIGLESTLAFLGIGLPPTTPSWGQQLGTLRQEPTAWWLAAGPGLALVFTILALQRIARQLAARADQKLITGEEKPNVTFEAF